MSKKLGAALAFGLTCGLLGGGAASAQVAGEYDGLSADGQSISITVAFDSGTGFYQIIGATVWYNAMCSGLGTGFFVDEGLGWGPGTELSDTTNDMVFDGNEENISANLRYHKNTNSFSGSIDTRLGALVPNGAARPTHVMKCESAWQPLTLSYAGPARVPPPAKGTVMHLSAGR
jgi:hypothetical protein